MTIILMVVKVIYFEFTNVVDCVGGKQNVEMSYINGVKLWRLKEEAWRL